MPDPDVAKRTSLGIPRSCLGGEPATTTSTEKRPGPASDDEQSKDQWRLQGFGSLNAAVLELPLPVPSKATNGPFDLAPAGDSPVTATHAIRTTTANSRAAPRFTRIESPASRALSTALSQVRS
jgi:hypothetical protein